MKFNLFIGLMVFVQILIAVSLNAAEDTERQYQINIERVAKDDQAYTVMLSVKSPEGEIQKMDLGTVAGIWSQGMNEDRTVIAANSYMAGYIHEWQIARKGDFIVAIHREFDGEIEGSRPPFTEMARFPVDTDANIDFDVIEEGMPEMLITEDVFHIIVASKESEEAAIKAAQAIVDQNVVSEVFARENGYYAVTIGSYPRSEMEQAKSDALDAGIAPKDAYFDSGEKDIKRVFPVPESEKRQDIEWIEVD